MIDNQNFKIQFIRLSCYNSERQCYVNGHKYFMASLLLSVCVPYKASTQSTNVEDKLVRRVNPKE